MSKVFLNNRERRSLLLPDSALDYYSRRYIGETVYVVGIRFRFLSVEIDGVDFSI
jgi:hypothetical protein